MKVVKKTNQYTIIKKKSGRYGVRFPNRSWAKGDEKVKILVQEGLIKASLPKEKPAEEAAEENKPAPKDSNEKSEEGDAGSSDTSSKPAAAEAPADLK